MRRVGEVTRVFVAKVEPLVFDHFTGCLVTMMRHPIIQCEFAQILLCRSFS